MSFFENLTYLATLGSSVLLLMLVFARRESVLTYRVLTATSLILISISIGLRWLSVGHPPILGTFEEVLAATASLLLFAFFLDKKGEFSRLSISAVILLLTYGLFFDQLKRPLVISELSLWVDFHVLFAWLCFGLYFFVFSAAVSTVLAKKANANQETYPTTTSLTKWLLGKGLLYGFFLQTIFFVIGAYYSSKLHGAWWVWDSVEYLFVISWLLYSVAIHGKLFFGWNESRTSWWIIGAFFSLLILYWGLIYFPWGTYHIFDMSIKVHFL
ncbi:MAG: cytochrome c biogenesis protein CcsA [Deltaproteobacteria bacterium]|nr:cytochrome c biogenesis protein CcsA [Deltaproteobacteria bacterium]